MDSALTRLFLSHAGQDWQFAQKLAQDLRALGSHITVDVDDLGVGEDVMRFMNEGIANADFILILHSKHSAGADNQIAEMDAALWHEMNQKGGTCIVVRLDDSDLPPLLGSRIYVDVDPESEESYARLLDNLAERIGKTEHPSSTVNKAFAADGGNPFRRTRAEYFEDDRELLARTFAPPDQGRLSKLEDMHPCILEGPRGTGKSMLLMSLRARNYLPGHTSQRGPSVFGCYLKLTRGALTNVLHILDDAEGFEAMLKETSSQELFLCILESLLSELRFCTDQQIVRPTPNDLQTLCLDLGTLYGLDIPTPRLDDLLRALAALRRAIAAYLRSRFIYGQATEVPTVAFDADLIADTIAALKSRIPILADHDFVILLDEYENLHAFQQEIINGLAKTAAPRFTMKIARKRSVGYPSSTPSGQAWQETHDYSTIDLVYNLADAQQRAAYMGLLGRFVEKIVRSELDQEVTLDSLLPVFEPHLEVDQQPRLEAVAALSKVSTKTFREWPEQKQRRKLTYYGTAATYRCLRGRRKRFSGPRELALVSSGIIRYFQEILAVGYYLYQADPASASGNPVIPPDVQSQAAHLVSAHNLTSLSKNVDGKGEVLRFFMLDIGGCLRHKLLNHSSEPEAGRIWLRDPELLGNEAMRDLRGLLDAGVREGVLELRDGRPGYLPRHSDDSQGIEYLICRIFAPVLGISPRARWRTETTCEELRQLLDRGGRLQAVRDIKARWVRTANERQVQLL